MIEFMTVQNSSFKIFLNRPFIIFLKCRIVGPSCSFCDVFFTKTNVICFAARCTSGGLWNKSCNVYTSKSQKHFYVVCYRGWSYLFMRGCAYEIKICFGLYGWDFLSTNVRLLYLSRQSTKQNFLLEENSSNVNGAWCLPGSVVYKIAGM